MLKVEPVNNSEGKYVRELSKKAEDGSIKLQNYIKCVQPEDSKLTDVLDKSEEEEKWEEQQQPRGLLH